MAPAHGGLSGPLHALVFSGSGTKASGVRGVSPQYKEGSQYFPAACNYVE